MAETKPRTNGRSPRQVALSLTYLAAAALGYALGVEGIIPYGPLKASTSTPLARIGLALEEANPRADATSWARLREDAEAVRSALSSPEREVFELVSALRGLENGGKADLAAAAQSCRALKLPRCDDPALEVIQKRSRP